MSFFKQPKMFSLKHHEFWGFEKFMLIIVKEI